MTKYIITKFRYFYLDLTDTLGNVLTIKFPTQDLANGAISSLTAAGLYVVSPIYVLDTDYQG